MNQNRIMSTKTTRNMTNMGSIARETTTKTMIAKI